MKRLLKHSVPGTVRRFWNLCSEVFWHAECKVKASFTGVSMLRLRAREERVREAGPLS